MTLKVVRMTGVVPHQWADTAFATDPLCVLRYIIENLTFNIIDPRLQLGAEASQCPHCYSFSYVAILIHVKSEIFKEVLPASRVQSHPTSFHIIIQGNSKLTSMGQIKTNQINSTK